MNAVIDGIVRRAYFLPAELARKLHLLAAVDERDKSAIVAEALTEYLERRRIDFPRPYSTHPSN
jgi:predicted DNA-binding protein